MQTSVQFSSWHSLSISPRTKETFSTFLLKISSRSSKRPSSQRIPLCSNSAKMCLDHQKIHNFTAISSLISATRWWKQSWLRQKTYRCAYKCWASWQMPKLARSGLTSCLAMTSLLIFWRRLWWMGSLKMIFWLRRWLWLQTFAKKHNAAASSNVHLCLFRTLWACFDPLFGQRLRSLVHLSITIHHLLLHLSLGRLGAHSQLRWSPDENSRANRRP